jgi:hypothetical protein
VVRRAQEKPTDWSRTGVNAICPREKKEDFGGPTGMNEWITACQCLIYLYAILLQNNGCFV